MSAARPGADDFARALAGAPLVCRAVVLDEVDSTMDEARDRAAREGAGLLVVARSQRRGRGRSDHAWASPPGGLYLSLVLDAAGTERAALAVTIVAGLAVRAALAEYGVAARLKWPNDVLVERRKIAGIIAEVSGRTIVLGIGVNVDVDVAGLPADVRAIATSIREETGRPEDVPAFARALLEALAPLHARWLEDDPELLREARAATILEHRVRWRTPSGAVHEGAPRDLGPRGELIIDTPGGPIRAAAGDLEVLWTS